MTCQRFECSSHHQGESEEVRTNVAIYSHALSNVCSHFFIFTLMRTGAFSQNVGKSFSELKLVTDNLLFIYAKAN